MAQYNIKIDGCGILGNRFAYKGEVGVVLQTS
jgi:hypothetical protein